MKFGGEGVYVKEHTPPNTLVALFNGVKYDLVTNLIGDLGKRMKIDLTYLIFNFLRNI